MNLKDIIKSYNVLNILCYLRRSRQDLEREKRTGEDTLTEQTDLMTRVLNSIELPYELKFEIGSGDSIEGRPVFQEVMALIESGKFQAIAVKEISRMSRGNMEDAGKVIKLITENRILIITPYKVYDPRNPMDMKQIRFELFLAREEYEMIKERMTGARYTYARQGKWVAGRSPFGFSYNKHTQKLAINEDEAKTVRLIFDLFLNGLNGQEVSYQAIATYLSKVGIKTPRGRNTWSYAQIKKILTNDLYIGTIRFRTTEEIKKGKKTPRPESEHIIVEDAHDPIIDKTTWDKVQTKIKNKVPEPHNPLDFTPNELASICTCYKCGGKLIRNCQKVKYKKQDESESVYIKEFLKCQKNYCMSVKYRDVENAILDYLNYISSLDDDLLKDFIEEYIETINNSSDNKNNKRLLEQIEHKEKELKSRLDFVYEKYEKRIYTDEMFIERKGMIDNEMQDLKKAKEELLKIDIEVDEKVVVKIKGEIGNLLKVYSKSNKESKNELLREIFDHIEVEVIKKGRGRISAEFTIKPYLRYNLLSLDV